MISPKDRLLILEQAAVAVRFLRDAEASHVKDPQRMDELNGLLNGILLLQMEEEQKDQARCSLRTRLTDWVLENLQGHIRCWSPEDTADELLKQIAPFEP